MIMVFTQNEQRASGRRLRGLLLTVALAMVFTVISSVAVAGPPVGSDTLPWSDPATWKDGSLPKPGTDVLIPAGKSVLLDMDPPSLGTLVVRGTIIFDHRDTDLTCRRIEVHEGGVFWVGSPAMPMTHTVTITLTGRLGLTSEQEPRTFSVMPGGRLELHGAPYARSWTKLSATAQAGDMTLQLTDPVDWPVGGEIVVTSTDFDLDQAERRTIARVGKPGDQSLPLDVPLDYLHWGAVESSLVDERGEVALLSRSIIIQGDDTSVKTGIGGHMIFHGHDGGPPIIHMAWVEVRRMGWVGRLARYPVHFHHAGSVAGSYISNVSIHDCYNRSLTIHDTHDLAATGNISCETIGHAFYLEDGVETGNSLIDNLGLLTRIPEPGMEVKETDVEPATFYITNNENTLIGNVAAGSEADGFWYHIPHADWGYMFALDYAAPPTFLANTAHSNARHGFFQDDRVFLEDGLIEDFTAYKNNHYGIWSRTYGTLTWRNAALADNGGGVYPATEGIIHTDDLQGLIVLEGCRFVGETSNTGTPETPTELTYGASLPVFWGEGPDPTGELSGVNLYDGLVLAVACSFEDYQDAQVGDFVRRAGAFTPVSYESPWAVDPRNAAIACTFDDANPVYFRQATEGANGVANTVLLDLDGCLTGVPGSTIVANNDFLDPLDGAGYVPAFNAHVVPPDVAYAQLLIINGDLVNPLPAGAPGELQIGLGFNGSIGPVNPSVGVFDNAVDPFNVFPSILSVGGEYEVILPAKTALDDEYVVTIRMNAPGSSVIIQVPSPTPPTAVLVHEFSLYLPLLDEDVYVDAVEAVDLADLRTDPLAQVWYDAAGGWLYLKPTLGDSFFNPGGTTIYDGASFYFTVTH